MKELVYEPAQKLMGIFDKAKAKIVVFVEVAELEQIEASGTDSAINEVKYQVQELHRQGHEIALHLHPQWYNARWKNGNWELDYSEYNLCTLPQDRIFQIVDRSISYFRTLLGVSDFTPFSFRAGNWLFQPTRTVANVLAERGIKVDSSVFKGGLQHQHKLDYRRALRNVYYWRFSDDVNVPNHKGNLLELPIHTQMVPTWKMFTSKRMGLQRKTAPASKTTKNHNGGKRLQRLMDFMRFQYPLKLDFCRMTINELTRMMDRVIKEDQQDPTIFRPIVAIGHTKDLVDFETVESFLSYLRQKKIPVATLEDVYQRCSS
ncbi:MAG: hypothetical protein U9R17_05280 [Thermodesulfobacteriota bacterium]|nr:hypothetical protein [Thermodesulfobacteriota bacterium]